MLWHGDAERARRRRRGRARRVRPRRLPPHRRHRPLLAGDGRGRRARGRRRPGRRHLQRLPGAHRSRACCPARCRRTPASPSCARPSSCRVETSRSALTALAAAGDVLRLPINHFEGNYVCDADDARAACATTTASCCATCDNPNGSLDDIAGVCNEQRQRRRAHAPPGARLRRPSRLRRRRRAAPVAPRKRRRGRRGRLSSPPRDPGLLEHLGRAHRARATRRTRCPCARRTLGRLHEVALEADEVDLGGVEPVELPLEIHALLDQLEPVERCGVARAAIRRPSGASRSTPACAGGHAGDGSGRAPRGRPYGAPSARPWASAALCSAVIVLFASCGHSATPSFTISRTVLFRNWAQLHFDGTETADTLAAWSRSTASSDSPTTSSPSIVELLGRDPTEWSWRCSR